MIPAGTDWWAAVYAVAAGEHGQRIGPLIGSQYHGRCPGCGERWEPGDRICFDEEQDAWICADCAGL